MSVILDSVGMMTLKMGMLDLNHKIALCSEEKTRLASQEMSLVDAGTDLDPNSPVYKQLQARRDRLHLLEKQIDAKMLKYQNQLKMMETQYQSYQQRFEKDVKESSRF